MEIGAAREVQHDRVAIVAVDRQGLPVVEAEGGYVEDVDAGVTSSRSGKLARAGIDRGVPAVEGTVHRNDAVVRRSGDRYTTTRDLSRVRGKNIEVAVYSSRAAQTNLSRAADADIADAAALSGRHPRTSAGGVGRDVADLERVIAASLEQQRIICRVAKGNTIGPGRRYGEYYQEDRS